MTGIVKNSLMMAVSLEVLQEGISSDVWLTVYRNSVWIRKTN